MSPSKKGTLPIAENRPFLLWFRLPKTWAQCFTIIEQPNPDSLEEWVEMEKRILYVLKVCQNGHGFHSVTGTLNYNFCLRAHKVCKATKKDSGVLMKETNRGSVRMVHINGNPQIMRH